MKEADISKNYKKNQLKIKYILYIFCVVAIYLKNTKVFIKYWILNTKMKLMAGKFLIVWTKIE